MLLRIIPFEIHLRRSWGALSIYQWWKHIPEAQDSRGTTGNIGAGEPLRRLALDLRRPCSGACLNDLRSEDLRLDQLKVLLEMRRGDV